MQKTIHVLLIDPDHQSSERLSAFLEPHRCEMSVAENGAAGIAQLGAEPFHVVLCDMALPDMSGVELLRQIAALQLSTPVIMMTERESLQAAIEAVRNGASDYIAKSASLDNLSAAIEKAVANASSPRQPNAIAAAPQTAAPLKPSRKRTFKGIVGESPAMQAVYDMIGKVADADSTVLITGESGTGKELIARTIHLNNTSRLSAPFVPINCGAIPRDLLESELFGHEKGAFTGAVNTRIGRFELAQGGTLFLDEVGELDPSLQVKLLRVIQEREFERVGGMKTIKVDVRILAATNKDLEQGVKDGRFREDLFYRLNVIPLHLPPLRSRQTDIQRLANHFALEFCARRKRTPFIFTPEAMDCLLRYSWPGNVRELENLMERLTILVSGATVQTTDLPEKLHQSGVIVTSPVVSAPSVDSITQPARQSTSELPQTPAVDLDETGINLNELVQDMERNLILKAIEKSGGVRARAAQLLGLNRTTLIEKMKKMGMEMPKK